MKDWWSNREPRERWLLTGAGLILVVLVIWLLLWEPVAVKRLQLTQRIESQQATLLAMQEISQRAATLTASGHEPRQGADGTLLGLADRTVRARGLAGSLRRIEPDGDRQVRVWLDQAPFDQTVGWLQSIAAEHGIGVIDANVSAGEQPGLVNLQVTLADEGH